MFLLTVACYILHTDPKVAAINNQRIGHMKKILILGIDGYLGWSVTKSLIAGDYIILGIDSGLRRKLVNEVGSDSLTPIQSLSDRVKETRRENITVEQVDICNTTKIFEIFERFSPDIVFNCAQ